MVLVIRKRLIKLAIQSLNLIQANIGGSHMARPKGNKDTTFLGIKIPKRLSILLDKDSKKHFRTKGNHILWILKLL